MTKSGQLRSHEQEEHRWDLEPVINTGIRVFRSIIRIDVGPRGRSLLSMRL